MSVEHVSTGVGGLDDVLKGGLVAERTYMIRGQPGTGKTILGLQFLTANSDDRSLCVNFEEPTENIEQNAESLGIDVSDVEFLDRSRDSDVFTETQSYDVFAPDEVESERADIVMIDGLSGYRLSIRGDKEQLVRELHSLCRYCKNMGVTVVITDDVESVTGDFEPTSARISYLAANIMFLRYLELEGELRKAAGVLKKRASDFERGLREFRITENGVEVDDPLTDLRGILTGTPELAEDGH